MPLFGWHGNTNNGRICWFILLAPKELILLTVILGMIPILTVVILYSIILFHAIKKIVQLKHSGRAGGATTSNLRMFRGGAVQESPESEATVPQKKSLADRIFRKAPSPTVKSPSKWKAIKIVLFTSASFVITWSPYFIASIVYVYQCQDNDSKRCKNLTIIIASPLAILGFTNSLINPIIYAWWHKGFRTFVQKRVRTMRMKISQRKNHVAENTTTSTKSTEPTVSSSPSKESTEIK